MIHPDTPLATKLLLNRRFYLSFAILLFGFIVIVTPHSGIAGTDSDGIPDIGEDVNGNGNLNDDDTDMDGLPNYRDADDDGDGIPTAIETFFDMDGDGIQNHLDPDSDNDGVSDFAESQVAVEDIDCDTIPNFIDAADNSGPCGPDYDEDGRSNEDEMQFVGADAPTNPDSDNDSVLDGVEWGNSVQPRDTDADGVQDILDGDDDGDGIPTRTERDECSHFIASTGLVDENGNPVPPFCRPRLRDIDTDGDGTPDYLDTNSDGGGPGDIPNDENLGDVDGDGIPNAYDPIDHDGPIADPDGDGLTNAQENALGTSFFDNDSDDDGIPDIFEVGGDDQNPLDTDGDGIIDAVDADDDNDGLLTDDEGFGDIDGDGIANHLDLDSDGDGFPDACEGTYDADVDLDGLHNFQDFFDGDGPGANASNLHSGTGDRDCDGLVDHVDANDIDGQCCFGSDFFCFGPTSISGGNVDANGCIISPFSAASPNSQARLPAQPVFNDDLTVQIGRKKFPMAQVRLAPLAKCDSECRKKNAKLLTQKVGNERLTCQRTAKTRNSPVRCKAGATDLSLWLIGRGLADAEEQASVKAKSALKQAKRRGIGVWSRKKTGIDAFSNPKSDLSHSTDNSSE